MAAISGHAIVAFAHDALYSAAGDLVVEPKLLHWLATYGGYCFAGMFGIMLAIQLWIDWPSIKNEVKS